MNKTQVVNVDDDSAKDTRIGELESEIDTLKEQISQAKSKNEVIFTSNTSSLFLVYRGCSCLRRFLTNQKDFLKLTNQSLSFQSSDWSKLKVSFNWFATVKKQLGAS